MSRCIILVLMSLFDNERIPCKTRHTFQSKASAIVKLSALMTSESSRSVEGETPCP
jgi:hypothetical protein